MNTIFKNLLKAIGIMCYFIILNFAYARMNTDRLINDIEIFAGMFLVLGLIMLERGYKKDSGNMALSGIELLCIAMHSLSINHVITFYKYDFRFYLLTSSYIISIYYVLKATIMYTKEKRQYLKNLSDISEIVKEEPIKKEAKKRRKVVNTTKKEEITKKEENKKTTEKNNKNQTNNKEENHKTKENKKENKDSKKNETGEKKKKRKKEVVEND